MQPKKHNKSLIVADETGTPTPPISRKALSKIQHVRAELASVYRHARAGQMDTAEASRLCYILSVLAKLIESDDLERRILALEKESTKR